MRRTRSAASAAGIPAEVTNSGRAEDPRTTDTAWDAVVIGEYQRAFYVGRYASMAPLFEHYGVGLWMPEVGGRVAWHAEDHEQTMLTLGLSTKREITRTRIRVRTAMAAQTREQAVTWAAAPSTPTSGSSPAG